MTKGESEDLEIAARIADFERSVIDGTVYQLASVVEQLSSTPSALAAPSDVYRLWWQAKATGYIGHGEPISRSEAEHARDWANAAYPEIIYWIMPAEAER